MIRLLGVSHGLCRGGTRALADLPLLVIGDDNDRLIARPVEHRHLGMVSTFADRRCPDSLARTRTVSIWLIVILHHRLVIILVSGHS